MEHTIETKAQEKGVKALPRGIYYKVLSEGSNDGKHPSPRSIVTAHYTGWTIDRNIMEGFAFPEIKKEIIL